MIGTEPACRTGMRQNSHVYWSLCLLVVRQLHINWWNKESKNQFQGRIQGKFGSPPFGGPPNFIKRKKKRCACARENITFYYLTVTRIPPFRIPVSAPELSGVSYLPSLCIAFAFTLNGFENICFGDHMNLKREKRTAS